MHPCVLHLRWGDGCLAAAAAPLPLQAQADSAGVLMDADQEGFSLADLEGSQEARPGPTAGRHTKRRR